jgi:cell wall-associated NlpC family hydrolase
VPRSGVRTLWRVLATAIAAAVVLGLSPAVATAAPRRPSDSQIEAARASADSVAARIGTLSGELTAAQAAVDDATAASAIALDGYQATQADYEAARARSDEAADAAAQATADLGVARGHVVTFARRSYMDGSTYAGAAALITAGDPGELVERAALLEAAGSHRSDVLDTVTVLQEQAQRAEAVARATVIEADELQQQAARELSGAQAAESAARRQAGALTSRRAQLTTELASAQRELRALVGAREAADRIARATPPPAAAAPQAATPAPAPVAAQDAAPDAGPDIAPVAPPAMSENDTPAGAGSASKARKAIDAALGYLGTPYSWGGGGTAGPGVGWAQGSGIVGFDCSGLTQYAYGKAGISIPRNSRSQYSDLPKVAASDLRAGDLVFWATNPANPSTIHHVALYMGNGKVVQAPQTGDVVKVSSMWWRGYAGAVRPSA